MVVHLLLIINRAAGLQFSKVYQPVGLNEKTLDSNLLMTRASMLSVLLGYTQQISPVPEDPLESSFAKVIEGAEQDMHFFRTPTGTIFVLVCSRGHSVPKRVFDELYLAFADYLMKHPTYSVDQPIGSAKHGDFIRAADDVIRRAQ
eukprot:CAMPEP_0174829098 /NCGR_PEP_ID=MMETSP1114-20130205/1731_1 /TAXON_ID=312471 /ORGANISM="Neobodo designis, Strain CCAP 1951/1" /LENGTH=145 /DNA_ID=CAMNT_0016062841 /DNA_START=43 /DNA_END=480 /DNA_ORIENTATION=+